MILQVILFLNVILYVMSDEVIETSTGFVRGITLNVENSTVEAFLGIPYAEPPIGELRFRKPLPKKKWSGVYDASSLPPPCVQNISISTLEIPDLENMTEDCLYLNIWIPKRGQSSSTLKPAIVYNHGGGFSTGATSSDLLNCAALAALGDVVVASFNFRIGALGYFSAFIEGANGNMGLEDAVMAAIWMSENAEAFGVDANRITVYGESSGAVTVAGTVFIKQLDDIVQRLIIQGGSPFTPGLKLNTDKRVLQMSTSLSNRVGCSNNTVNLKSNPEAVVDCLRHVDPSEVTLAEGVMMESMPLTFIPRLDGILIPKDMIERFRKGEFKNVDVLIGINDNEGAFFVTVGLSHYFGNVYGSNYVKLNKRLVYRVMSMGAKLIGHPSPKEIANVYIKNSESDDYTPAAVKFLGDLIVNCPSIFLADFFSLHNNTVYFYKNTHRASSSKFAPWMGATHSDYLQFVFGFPVTRPSNYTSDETKLSKRIIDRWTAFAKNGNPNIPGEITWPRYTHENPMYLEIGFQEKVNRKPMERCELWRETFNAKIDEELLRKM